MAKGDSIQVRLEAGDRLKKKAAACAAKGYPAMEKFLHDAAMGLVTETIVVDVWKPDPETGKMVRCKEAQEVPACIKDRVGAAKAWKELCVDKTAADKKEMAKPPAEKTAASVSKAIQDVAEKKRKEGLKLLQGGKA